MVIKKENGIKEVELIVSGRVQSVGYRQYVAEIGNKLKLTGSVQNLKDCTVKIQCRGEGKNIGEFKKKIRVENPSDAPFVKVEKLKENTVPQGTIKQTYFEEIYDDPSAEMSQGFSTGMKYMTLFNRDTQENLNLFRKETNENFKNMDEKYHLISENMIAIVTRLEKNNKTFEARIEKTEKSIESLLKILTQKQS